MSVTPPRNEIVDEWFYDLEAMGRQVERNGRAAKLANTRTRILFAIIVVFFGIMAWRTEVNASKIRQTQMNSCVDGVKIIAHFNEQQEKLAVIEQDQTALPDVAARRIQAYRSGKIIPLPSCGS